MNKVFITGGSGFIGRSLVRLLISNGLTIKALARSEKSEKCLEELGAIPVRGDILNAELLRTVTEDCAAVFHLAGIVSYQVLEWKRMNNTNLQGTRNIIDAVKHNKIPKFIYCSTVSVLGGSQGEMRDENSHHDGVFASEYEKSKYLAHKEILEFSKTYSGVVIALPALAMGRGGDDILGVYIKAFCEGKLPFLVALNNAVSYVYVEDVAQGLFLCFKKGTSGQQYIFSSDQCTPNQLANLLERFSGKSKPRFTLPPFAAVPLLVADELISYLTRKKPALTLESLRVLQGHSWTYSGEKARKELGWQPINMEQMVREILS